MRNSEKYLEKNRPNICRRRRQVHGREGISGEVLVEKRRRIKKRLSAWPPHGRSEINRSLLGSVAEKVLRSTTSPLLLVRASDEAKTEGEAPSDPS